MSRAGCGRWASRYCLWRRFDTESGGSPHADDIDTLYKVTLYVGLVIFLIVEGTLLWSLVRYRARRGHEAAQRRGNTPLEVGWTIGAALILVVLTVVTFVYLGRIESPPESGPKGLRPSQTRFASIDQPAPPSGRPYLKIGVNGQQYLWRYDYPGKRTLFSHQQMVVPVDTTVVLEITASDVIHSWWIPEQEMESYWSHGSEASRLPKPKNPAFAGVLVVAGAGFEPATFGL